MLILERTERGREARWGTSHLNFRVSPLAFTWNYSDFFPSVAGEEVGEHTGSCFPLPLSFCPHGMQLAKLRSWPTGQRPDPLPSTGGQP